MFDGADRDGLPPRRPAEPVRGGALVGVCIGLVLVWIVGVCIGLAVVAATTRVPW